MSIIKVLFRTDGSQYLGIGHIMRCLAFAQGLEKAGVSSMFVIRNCDQQIAEVIQRYGYNAEVIPRGYDFKKDVTLTLGFADRNSVSWLVTDLCNTDILRKIDEYRKYLQGLKSTGKLVVTIDDVNEISFASDIVVNPNYGAETMRYKFSEHTKYLLGPTYFIFRKEFIKAAQKSREIREEPKNILVTMGGNDLLNLTSKVVSALSKIDLNRLNFKIITGIAYSKSKTEQLTTFLKRFNGNYELIPNANNMSDLMLWADLAITACGLTRYETAITGTPSITISQHCYENKLMQAFKTVGTTEYLGYGERVSEKDILWSFQNLVKNKKRRHNMSRKGQKLVDGKGIERIINSIKMIQENYYEADRG